MAIENLRIFHEAKIDKYGNINALFINEEWTDGILTNKSNHRQGIHVSRADRSEFEQIQAFSSMARFFPVPGGEPAQTDVDRISGKIAESERILNAQRLELININNGNIIVDGEVVGSI